MKLNKLYIACGVLFFGAVALTGCSDDEVYDVDGSNNNLIYVDQSIAKVTECTVYHTPVGSYGDITANSLISGEPVEGDTFVKRASGGILADGFNSMLAGALNSFPNSVFAQNNGMIQLTGVASRYVGYYIAAFLVLLGLFPAVGLVFSLMPEPVLGGATLLMFGTVAAAGIRIIAAQEINRKATLVMAVSFSLGLSVELVPEILCQLLSLIHI